MPHAAAPAVVPEGAGLEGGSWEVIERYGYQH